MPWPTPAALSAYLSDKAAPRGRRSPAGRRGRGLPASAETDARYGLDPVLDVSKASGSDLLEGFVNLSCPYCAESYGVAVDLSAGSQTYIEDCQVCCQPINLRLTVDDAGRFVALEAERLDR